MRLLPKETYSIVEELLRTYKINAIPEEPYKLAMNEIIDFFNTPIYREFLELFYFDRHNYLYRYPDNRSMLNYIGSKLFIQENTYYQIRKEIVYKSAMIFYKYGLLR